MNDDNEQWDTGAPLTFTSQPMPNDPADFGGVKGVIVRVQYNRVLVRFHASFPQWHPYTVQCEHSAERR